jgi:membrane associated rhomboid family serine protease
MSQPAAGPEAVPVCPRHPDRESYVRCQRCERPVCPECQRPAAVGIQCVDCVREQSRGVRPARTIFGGAAVAGAARPVVTQSIIAICVVVFVLQMLPGSTVTGRFAYAPVATLAEPWRLLTSAFLHSPNQLFHILFNMYALWLTGPYLEHLFGRARFALLYLLSAIGGSIFYLALASPDKQQWWAGAVGASGAVFGLFAALLVVNRKLGRESGGIIAVLVINAVIGFIPGFNIAWQAHLGGLVTGAAVALVMAYAPRERRLPVQVTGVLVVVLALIVLAVLKVAVTPADAFV